MSNTQINRYYLAAAPVLLIIAAVVLAVMSPGASGAASKARQQDWAPVVVGLMIAAAVGVVGVLFLRDVIRRTAGSYTVQSTVVSVSSLFIVIVVLLTLDLATRIDHPSTFNWLINGNTGRTPHTGAFVGLMFVATLTAMWVLSMITATYARAIKPDSQHRIDAMAELIRERSGGT